MRTVLAIVALLAVFAVGDDDDAAKAKAVRMKTSRQLKEILTELDIEHSGLDKDGLRELALKEDAVSRWEEIHPEKKRKPRAAGGGGGGGGIPGLDGMEAPEGMDPLQWERLMAQMRGDHSHEKDPEKRRILEKLQKMGMSFGGGSDMSLEQLQNLEKTMGNLGDLRSKDAPKDEV